MADTIEKVYCTGDGGNDNLAAALLLVSWRRILTAI